MGEYVSGESGVGVVDCGLGVVDRSLCVSWEDLEFLDKGRRDCGGSSAAYLAGASTANSKKIEPS